MSSFSIPSSAWKAGLVGGKLAIATTEKSSFNVNNNSGGDFYGRRLKMIATFASDQTAKKGSCLASSPSPTLASNDHPSQSLVTVNLKVGNRQIWTQELSLQALMGEEGDGWWITDLIPKVEQTQDVIVTYTNNSAYTINLEMWWDGFAVPKGTQVG